MYQQRIVIDGLQYCNWNREYFQTLKASGITAVHATAVYHETARETLSRFAEWNLRFEQNADIIMPIHSMADVETAKATGKVGIFLGAQNCSPIDDEIGLIEVMRQQGLLIMQLDLQQPELIGDGLLRKERHRHHALW